MWGVDILVRIHLGTWWSVSFEWARIRTNSTILGFESVEFISSTVDGAGVFYLGLCIFMIFHSVIIEVQSSHSSLAHHFKSVSSQVFVTNDTIGPLPDMSQKWSGFLPYPRTGMKNVLQDLLPFGLDPSEAQIAGHSAWSYTSWSICPGCRIRNIS